jgi:hypothetical protein
MKTSILFGAISARSLLSLSVAAVISAGTILLSGCATGSSDGGTSKATGSGTNDLARPVVTPQWNRDGTVVRVNLTAHFVVVNFPASPPPGPDQVLYVYRDGLRVGEVKVNGPRSGDCVVADIVSGDCRAGDTARVD